MVQVNIWNDCWIRSGLIQQNMLGDIELQHVDKVDHLVDDNE